ncbi:hypothetical protein SELMODRAFT_169412 [Selaginella moellendorffii]|uniref:[RNA-polymerase]-subunit kinase n=1 Tax=Selaginella moellendorffii TaxID=88036 RepID=D8RAA9_SELML|nr:cyclin-dependent kinase C-2 [Selaginella moellendorffii]EFJ31297.1 hypothetical protein SELMODRAFT_169412 [Selaginella moellendorffii]|eukprot:XP_002967950.1 cyclin-dependent kinase C-2 [Selaginella moellendorffii]
MARQAAADQLNLCESPSWGSRSVECFEKLEQIGEGTYGQVYMAREKDTNEIVALKKVRMDNEKEGFPITAIREIKILKKLQHENVIKLKEIVTSTGPEQDDPKETQKDGPKGAKEKSPSPPDGNIYKGSIYMVFEYMDHDLTGLSDRPGMRFTVPQIKCYMKQLLTGLYYCHINQVLHRDIKGSNLLIDNKGNLKLADFGLARSFSNDQNALLTNRVITLWYRPPELLLGCTKYGPAVDMWSVGCIFAELLYGKPVLTGKNEQDQLAKIFEFCGTPDETNWPGVSKLPWYNMHRPSIYYKRRVKDVFKQFDRHALDLVERMLTLDPLQRIIAKDALDAEYFWTDPLPCDPASLPRYESSHEFQTKRKRQQQKDDMAKRQKPNQNYHHNSRPPPPIQQQPPVQNMRPVPGQAVHPSAHTGGAHQGHYAGGGGGGGGRGPPGNSNRHPQAGGRPGGSGGSGGSSGGGYQNRNQGGYGIQPPPGAYGGPPPAGGRGGSYPMPPPGGYPQGPPYGGGGRGPPPMGGGGRGGQQYGPPNSLPGQYSGQPYGQPPQQYMDMDGNYRNY